MEYGICNLSIIPCRKEPADQSEMVSQLLFGDHFKVLEKRKKWSRIRNAFDKYESWIDNKQYQLVSSEFYRSLDTETPIYSNDLISIASGLENVSVNVLLGSRLPKYDNGTLKIENDSFQISTEITSNENRTKKQLVTNALRFLNVPYLWGGVSPLGIDCSGFTQLIYKLNGMQLPRDAYQQAELGESLSFVEEAEPGDLAFFDNEEGNIIHVGIVLENNHIIHASGKVRIDRIDHQGIHNQETRSYSHKLRIIKRITKNGTSIKKR